MGRVTGVKEKLHSPLYDAVFVPPGQTFRTALLGRDPRVLRFFVDVQGKTKLETNQQAAGVLPSLNTFEARAMRVVVSPLDPNSQADETDDQGNGPPLGQRDLVEFLVSLIYSSVTSLLVGEKTMIEMPTYWFPAGAGVLPGRAGAAGSSVAVNHGEPDPTATFRFAEPVFLEPQQNFRVEMVFPNDVPDAVRFAIGPLRLWVVLDGYLTRDVQ
jgi:hypothetical protein